jgi:hypothetical protein
VYIKAENNGGWYYLFFDRERDAVLRKEIQQSYQTIQN